MDKPTQPPKPPHKWYKPVMRPLKRDYRTDKAVYGFDIETHSQTNEFVCACIVGDGGHSQFYTDVQKLRTALQSDTYANSLIITTNLGFDFLGVFYDSPELYSMAERDGRIYRFQLLANKATFLDTLNYLPASVKELGKLVGVAKLPHPSCFGRVPATSEEWLFLHEYCRNDALISYLWFKQYIYSYFREHKLRFCNTIAATSMSIFRKKYLTRTFTIESRRYHDLAFKAYYGGRTEIFKRGSFDKVNYYDVNSLYPFSMLNEFPDPDSVEYTKISSLHYIYCYEGLSYVEGWMPDQYAPPLPVRVKGRVLFPTGKIKGHYTHIDIRYAVECGFVITALGESLYYHKTVRPFDSFITDHYAKRLQQKKNNDPMQLMTKLVMNSHYGKYAFDYRTTNEIKHISHVSLKDIQRAKKVIEHGEYFELYYESYRPTSYSIPIWSAYVTSYARILLHQVLRMKKETVIYCDTDSVFLVNDEIPNSDKLGDFKKENKEPLNGCIFVRPKFYYAEKPKVKGVKWKKEEDGIERDPRELFLELLDTCRIDQEIFAKYRTVVKSHDGTKRGKLQVNEIIQTEKTFDLNDTKRKWRETFTVDSQQDSEPRELSDADYVESYEHELFNVIIR